MKFQILKFAKDIRIKERDISISHHHQLFFFFFSFSTILKGSFERSSAPFKKKGKSVGKERKKKSNT